MNDIIFEIQDLRYLKWTKIRNSSGTAGSFLKAQDETGDRKIYYKLSDYDSVRGITGHECVNEIIAQRLLDVLGFEHLTYTLVHALVRIDDKEYITWLCRSSNFRKKGESKIALEDFYAMERQEGESPMDFCRRMNWENYIYGMLVTDFLISNRDRHGANIEVLIDRKRKRIRPAPLFDHGLSFMCRCQSPDEVDDFDVMKDVKIQSFVGTGSAFDNLAMIPQSFLCSLCEIGEDKVNKMLCGLNEAIAPVYIEKIREMITRRWKYIEDIRNT